jgi:glycosyltransferase involved in cell wall biosynthesis
MRVALDARTLQDTPLKGVGRAIAHFLPHVIDQLEVELLTAAELPSPELLAVPEHRLRTPWPGVGAAWLQWSAARFLRDFEGVFHCPFYALPFYQRIPMVATIHDLTFERHPEWFSRRRAASFRVQARWAARTARVVFAPSRTVADDIAQTYGVPHSRLAVAYNGLDPIFRPDHDVAETLDRLGVRQPYVIALGGAPRRNADVAIEAWRSLRDTHEIGLLVCGSVNAPPAPGLVVAQLSDNDWSAALSGAEAFLYPTGYEGFGMPALEAAASGTPVVCGRVGALPEVLGDSAAWTEGIDASAMARTLGQLLNSSAWHSELRQQGIARAREHISWKEIADVYVEGYCRAAQG